MNLSTLIKPVAVAATAFGILMLPGLLAAQAPSQARFLREYPPSGNYLAARHAIQQRDAAVCLDLLPRRACGPIRRIPNLLDRAFVAALTEGDIEETFRLAERVCRSTRTIATRGSCSASARIKNKQWQSGAAPISRNRCAARSPT